MLFLVPDFLVRLLDLMVLVLEMDATHGTVDCNSTLHFFLCLENVDQLAPY